MSAIYFKDAGTKKKDLERGFVVEPIKVNGSGGISLDPSDQVNVFTTSELLKLIDCELGQLAV